MRLKLTVIIIFLGLFYSKCNQSVQNEDVSVLDKEALPVMENFFYNIKSGDTSAIVNLLKQNINIELRDSLTQDLLNKFNLINQGSGVFISEKLLRKKLLNDDIGVYCYLVKYEKKFYRFTFVFYNNDKEVRVFRFSFDETADIELEESIKLYVN